MLSKQYLHNEYESCQPCHTFPIIITQLDHSYLCYSLNTQNIAQHLTYRGHSHIPV